MKTKLGKGCLVVIGVIAVGIGIWLFVTRDKPVDTRFSGAYRFDDGRLVFVTPRDSESARYRLMSGESAALRPASDLVFEAGPGWAEPQPVEVTVTFDAVDTGPPAGLSWRTSAGEWRAERLPLTEVFGSFQSGELALRAKLVLPEGEGRFPAVVFVHGSGADSAVDTYYNPYKMAAHGIAGLAFDKRGTGGSEGDYNQNFHLLSDDVAAAVDWLRTRPEIDPDNIHLAGYSQGGWIAPLAATKSKVTSLLINYGPMVPITGEDRWGYVYALQQAGFGEEAVREVDVVSEIAGRIMDHGEDRWSDLERALEEIEDAEWIDAVKGSDSMVGFLTQTRLPMWAVRLYAWWMTRGDEPFVDRLYDPVPTLAALDVPSLWIFGGEDSSMPTQWSIDELETLQAAGRPIEIEIFSEAEHGILLFEEGDDGERSYLGYAPGYLQLQVDWIRRLSGLLPNERSDEQVDGGEGEQPDGQESVGLEEGGVETG